MRRLRFLTEASEDLDGAIGWYEDHDRGLGAEFLAAINTRLEWLADMPGIGSRVAEIATTLDLRKSSIRRFPYKVVYSVTDDEITIVAIAHHKRSPRYWIKRLTPG